MLRQSEFLGEFEKEHYKITKDYIDSSIPQTRLFHTKYIPHAAKYTICIIHGFGEHSTRFHPVADYYARNQFEVLLIDLKGFGYSGGPRGAAEIRELENDVIALLKQAREDLPLFLYGHSMGGLTVIKLLLERPEINASGCIITSPLLGLGATTNLPWHKVMMLKLLGDGMADFIINSKVNPTALTKQKKYLHTIFEDRMMIPFMCVNMGKSTFEAIQWVKQHRNQFRYPVIVFHGKQDTVTNYDESRKFIYDKVKPFKEFYSFDYGYHELQHDVEKDQLLNRSVDFIRRLPNLKNFGKLNITYIPKPKPKSSVKAYVILFLIAVLLAIIKWRKYLMSLVAK